MVGLKTLGISFLLTSMLAATCHAGDLILPQLEIHVPLSVSVSSDGEIESVMQDILSKGKGFKLGDEGAPLDKVADITVLGAWSGADIISAQRSKLTIHGDSYLVMKIDEEVEKRDSFERGLNPGCSKDLSIFGFSNGNYFTKQCGTMYDVRYYNGVFTQRNDRMELNQVNYGHGPCTVSFVGIEKRGIPVIGYLYSDSEAADEVRTGIIRVEAPQLVMIKGKKYCRYAFTRNLTEVDGHSTDMYFFTLDGNLAKYGYETLEYHKDRNIREWNTALYDVHELSTYIPDKSCFINPVDARMIGKSITYYLVLL